MAHQHQRAYAAFSRLTEVGVLLAELVRALSDGPGIVVLAGAFGEESVVDRATRQFEAIIACQRAAGSAAGDHFARSGQNDRIWNALEKLALRAPEVFAAGCAGQGLVTMCNIMITICPQRRHRLRQSTFSVRETRGEEL
jgi:ectoine hydroxylase-related dioxygenase (phytanoyl-CoA dioxygenase family)